jgi:hypothetical protein
VVATGWEEGEQEVITDGHGAACGGDESGPELDSSDGCKTLSYTKTQ